MIAASSMTDESILLNFMIFSKLNLMLQFDIDQLRKMPLKLRHKKTGFLPMRKQRRS